MNILNIFEVKKMSDRIYQSIQCPIWFKPNLNKRTTGKFMIDPQLVNKYDNGFIYTITIKHGVLKNVYKRVKDLYDGEGKVGSCDWFKPYNSGCGSYMVDQKLVDDNDVGYIYEYNVCNGSAHLHKQYNIFDDHYYD